MRVFLFLIDFFVMLFMLSCIGLYGWGMVLLGLAYGPLGFLAALVVTLALIYALCEIPLHQQQKEWKRMKEDS